VAELALDDVERYALVGEFDGAAHVAVGGAQSAAARRLGRRADSARRGRRRGARRVRGCGRR
jgi:hypothetical protein